MQPFLFSSWPSYFKTSLFGQQTILSPPGYGLEMALQNLLEINDCGIYCPQADVYIDPWKPVNKAIITHAHSDHARWGSKKYLAHHDSEAVMRLRLGNDINLESTPYNKEQLINGVRISFHPAGHITGSAQIRLEYKGAIWVVSGDYKIEPDSSCTPFEAVRCHNFITESTFGLPVFKWKPQKLVFEEINQWWQENKAAGKTSILCGYALGKAQRLIANVDPSIGKIFVHGAVANVNAALQQNGLKLPPYTFASPDIPSKEYPGSLIIAPPSAINTPWMKKFSPYSTAMASGWMNIRGTKRRRAVDKGFVLSDHADWDGLNLAVKETGCEKVWVTHGYTAVYSRWLQEQGLEAREVHTLYNEELEEIKE